MIFWQLAKELIRALAGRPCRASPPRSVFSAYVPAENPLKSDVADQGRWEAAQRLMQEDTYGYLLLTVHKEAVGPVAEIRLAQDVDPSWWPAIEGTLDAVLAVTRELP